MKNLSVHTRKSTLFKIMCFFTSLTLNVEGVPIANEVRTSLLVEEGSEAQSHEFPWQVSLRTSLNYLHFCGGVIIDERTVLTTAACAEVASPYITTVVAGNINLSIANASESQQIVQVTSTHIHPNYAEQTDHSNDIAILKVNPAFSWTEDVASIQTLHASDLVPTEVGVISGWGTKREEEISLQEKLQKATVRILNSNQDCQKNFGGDALRSVIIEDSMICITAPSSNSTQGLVDSCTGDQGGPLVIYEDSRSVLVGLVSFGIGCGRPNMPSFCTRVSPYIEFIRQYQES